MSLQITWTVPEQLTEGTHQIEARITAVHDPRPRGIRSRALCGSDEPVIGRYSA